ncbi:MAG: trypsin-like peptidase domain-containing protein [Bryobacterales bacterium]|nr:trypsin-like peptidase domain-containing protein [Bryobacterales bacterium]
MQAAWILTLTMAAAGFAAAARIHPLASTKTTDGVADVVERTVPSVVRVLIDAKAARRAAGEASGIVISPDGYILTNHHVIDGASAIKVQLHDEREFPANLVASDPPTDLAVLKIGASALPHLEFGDSRRLRVGDAVLAIGNPFGIGVTVTAGIVSARGRSLGAGQFEDYIQTDAAINPGNSGGPLLNRDGELIGINTAILSPSGASNGIGFAVPSNLARAAMSDLIVHGRVLRGYLGLGLQPLNASLAEALGLDSASGALIADVAPASPAALAGIEKGSVLRSIDGVEIRSFDRLRLFIASAKPGAKLTLRALTPAGEQDFAVTLIEKPHQPAETQEQLPGGAVVSAAVAPASGILLLAVDPNGQFAAAGIKAGDVIACVNRTAVASVADMRREIGKSDRNNVLIEVNRAGSAYFVAVERTGF